jgi:DNA-binding transcriptional LysR family regulator
MQSLIKGESHFAISHAHPQVEMNLPPMHFTSKLVGTDRLLPVTLPDSAGSPLDKLPGTEDEPVHYLAYTETSAIGQAVEHMINNVEEPVYLDKVFVSQLAAVLKTLSREGRGMAWLPESNISDELASGSLVLAGGEKWFIPVEIRIFRSRERLPAMAEELWSILEGEAVPADAPSPENC